MTIQVFEAQLFGGFQGVSKTHSAFFQGSFNVAAASRESNYQTDMDTTR